MPLYIHRQTFNIFGGYYLSDKRDENCFEVDELIAKPVQILNRKGYLTGECCSGHPFVPPPKGFCESIHMKPTHYSYISFIEGISLPSLPPGFIKREHGGTRVCIDRWYHDKRDYECLREIFKSMELLYLWASNLPDFKSLRK